MANLPSSMKAPPIFNENESYDEYIRDLEIWQLLKSATDEEEGVIIYRTLTGRAKASCNDLTPAQIGSRDGLKLIRERLNKIFRPEENQRIFIALDEFEKCKRPGGMTMSNFILQFENLHNKVKMYKCTYPDGVLAYRLMKAANVSHEHEKLCKATIETGKWTYEAVCDQLRKIFSEVPTPSPTPSPIKVENTYVSNHQNFENNYSPELENFDQEEDGISNEFHTQEVNSPNKADYDIYYGNNKFNNQNRFRKSYGGVSSNKFVPNYKQTFHTPQGYQKLSYKRFDDSRPPTNSEFQSLRKLYNSDPNITNPKDNKGNYTICRRCRSIFHWISDCPHVPPEEKPNTYYTSNTDDEIYIALLQSCVPHSKDEISSLVSETFGKGVIDSGCSKTVAGINWLNDYLQTLSEDEQNSIQYSDSHALFRFGDSNPVISQKKALLPMTIGDKNVFLSAEIVESDVPLLLSKDTMKTLKANMNFETDSMTIFGKQHKLLCTSSGHYAIPIRPACSSDDFLKTKEGHVVLFNSGNDLEATARKLHQQFSHPSDKRLIDLVKTSGVNNEDLFLAINKVSEQCDTCKRYKKTPPRPVVSLPLATEFNETVALDLKVYENNKTYFLHIIDHATRFSAGAVIKSKKREVIIDEFFKRWVSIFGSPMKVLGDNGGEFANSDFVDMCQNLNVNFVTTAAESPWSNGLVEKHNDILGEAVSKILEEVECSVEVALCWAINAKNSLQNIYGFSPYMLVFGRNPNLPSVLTDKLPALEGVTASQLVGQHLNAMHKARQEFVKLESSEKLRRALRSKTRTHSNIKYFPGDNVFFKRDDERRWKGPGRVLGTDGSKILIKTPCSVITVHSSRVILTSEAEINRQNEENSDAEQNNSKSENLNQNIT